jgi:hypothetical protein
MPQSTPADLTVTFRSLARRQREAIGDADPGTVTDLVGDLAVHVAAAAQTLGTEPDAEAVATAISSRPADDWDEATLDTLRQHALEAGRILRAIAARVEAQDH